MHIRLTPQHEELIRSKIASGEYRDPSEVVEDALRLMDERDRMAALRAALAIGDAQIARGETILWTPELLNEIIREAEEEDRLGLPIRDDVKP
jgi:antitoxin ParD1/3/4